MFKSFFILSTGRTGTTSLSKIFADQVDEDRSLHQTKSSGRINILSNIGLKHNFAKNYLIRNVWEHNSPPPSTTDPLKTMGLVLYLNDLIRNNPEKIKNVAIIHIIRDPRDFVTSFMNWKNRKLSGIIADRKSVV